MLLGSWLVAGNEPLATPPATGAFTITATGLTLSSYSILTIDAAHYNVTFTLIGSTAQTGTKVTASAVPTQITDLAGNQASNAASGFVTFGEQRCCCALESMSLYCFNLAAFRPTESALRLIRLGYVNC